MKHSFVKALGGLVLFSSLASGVDLQFRRGLEHMEEVGSIVVCILEEPRAQYVFRQPFNWEASFDENSRTVTMALKKDPKSWITIRLAASANSPGDGVRAYAHSAFPKGNFQEKFTMHTASKEAEVIDFTDPSAGYLKRRLALLRSPSGTFEILLSSRPDDAENGEQAFAQLMSSFEFRGPPEKSAADRGPAAASQ